MAFARLKAARRRRRLAAHGIAPELSLASATYGARTGHWTVATEGLGPEAVVHSYGVGDNVAWELAMIERHGVTVHAFDPTPLSVAWVREVDLPERFRFHPVGLAGFDGELELHPPRRPTSLNYSVLPSGRGRGAPILCRVARLGTHAAALGHERIDVLKMDVEGAETTALPELLENGPPVGQLLVELHYGHPSVDYRDTIALLHRIRAHGFRVLEVSERGYELSFVHESWPWPTQRSPPCASS